MAEAGWFQRLKAEVRNWRENLRERTQRHFEGGARS